MLFNTRYLDAALTRLRADGFDVRDQDVARLSPDRPPPHQRARPVLLPAPRPGRRAAASARQARHRRRVTGAGWPWPVAPGVSTRRAR
ncbi:hypothetical protein R8789_46050 [Streptomyces malaysiensis]|nr:hypothetical protein R8789_46050 [Streptomyces malaysiensis]